MAEEIETEVDVTEKTEKKKGGFFGKLMKSAQFRNSSRLMCLYLLLDLHCLRLAFRPGGNNLFQRSLDSRTLRFEFGRARGNTS